MRMLAFSDVDRWGECQFLAVDKVKPDIIILAGDLTWDGFAPFYYRDKGIRSEVIQKRIHADQFYRFLKYAGGKAPVLVVKGNHDEEGDYDSEKINEVAGCREISGKFFEVKESRFLGFGFNEAHSIKAIRSMIEEFGGKAHIAVMHGEHIRLISSLKPRIVIKGGGVLGNYLVNDVPSVYTGPGGYAIITSDEKTTAKVSFFGFGGKRITGFVPLYEHHKWIKPYPIL
jgi:predicted phosphodiesterase